MANYSSTSLNPFYNPFQQTINALTAELKDLFDVVRVTPSKSGIAFVGRLLYEPEFSYDEVQRRFRAYGYTPMFSRRNGQDVILARKGLIARARNGSRLVNLLLLVATIFTTLAAGASMAGVDVWRVLLNGDAAAIGAALSAGVPFSVTLLTILGVHELGHYVAARWHGVQVTLPYFIPVPGLGLGTLGAFISLKSPMKNRKVLFDIGVAGPLAGFIVALPLLVVGLLLSDTAAAWQLPGGLTLGRSALIEAVYFLFSKPAPGLELVPHPIYFAAWIGILITGINLLPVGQLDGGHVAYALFGRYAHRIALATFALLIMGGLLISGNWFVWAFFVLLGGLRHPAPLNDIVQLDPVRRAVGLATIILFFATFIPAPFG